MRAILVNCTIKRATGARCVGGARSPSRPVRDRPRARCAIALAPGARARLTRSARPPARLQVRRFTCAGVALLVPLGVHQLSDLEQLRDILVGALERGEGHRRAEPLAGDRLGPGELAQPVGAVDAAEA